MSLRKYWRNFAEQVRGQHIAIVFALVCVPVLMVAIRDLT